MPCDCVTSSCDRGLKKAGATYIRCVSRTPIETIVYTGNTIGSRSYNRQTVSRTIFALGMVCVAWMVAGCSKTETAQARGRDTAAKPVQVEAVRQETVRRAVEVVGTLAAVDQVTVSSETEGKVSRILADLGDRVTAGQALIQLDNE